MNRMQTMEDILLEELKDLYSAEQQIMEAMPKVIQRASAKELKQVLTNHMEETKGQIARLEQVESILNKRLSGGKCEAMEGLIRECQDVLSLSGNPALIDVLITGACQRIEHYEIAGYGTARTIAEQMGYDDVADLCQTTLDEESNADEELTRVSEDEILPNCPYEAEEEQSDEEGRIHR